MGQRHLVAVLREGLGVLEKEIGGLGGGFVGERFALEEFVGGLDHVGDGGDGAEDDAGVVDFVVGDVGGGGATDEGPVELAFCSALKVHFVLKCGLSGRYGTRRRNGDI